jgi:hypothetical protein
VVARRPAGQLGRGRGGPYVKSVTWVAEPTPADRTESRAFDEPDTTYHEQAPPAAMLFSMLSATALAREEL